jgi:archaellum component FlaC
MSDPDTQAALREMSRSIGGLESTVKTLVTTWQSQEQQASQGRRDLHAKVDALKDEVKSYGQQLAAAVKDINDMKPTVDGIVVAKQQAAGVGKLGKALGTVAVFLSGGGAGAWILSWFTSPKH